MSSVEPFYVAYAERVRRRLFELGDIAAAQGDREAFRAAVKEFDRLLHVYPQFGEPLSDLVLEPGCIWVGIVYPLSMRYAVFDERRMVMVGAIPVLLSKSGRES